MFQGTKGRNCTHKTMKTEEGGKRGSRWHFTGNKLMFSQFTTHKKKAIQTQWKSQFTTKWESFLTFHIENNFAKTMLHGYLMKINENRYSQGRKIAISHFKGNKKCRWWVKKIPFNCTLTEASYLNSLVVKQR